VKWLRHVVIRPGLEAPQPIGLAGPAREDQHRQVRVEAVTRAADLPEHLDPARIGQTEVEQHQVRVVVAAEPQGIGRARRREHAVAVGGEVVAEQLARRVVVLADHHGGELFDGGQHGRLRSPALDFSPRRPQKGQKSIGWIASAARAETKRST
jgi:hypothetical protein